MIRAGIKSAGIHAAFLFFFLSLCTMLRPWKWSKTPTLWPWVYCMYEWARSCSREEALLRSLWICHKPKSSGAITRFPPLPTDVESIWCHLCRMIWFSCTLMGTVLQGSCCCSGTHFKSFWFNVLLKCFVSHHWVCYTSTFSALTAGREAAVENRCLSIV